MYVISIPSVSVPGERAYLCDLHWTRSTVEAWGFPTSKEATETARRLARDWEYKAPELRGGLEPERVRDWTVHDVADLKVRPLLINEPGPPVHIPVGLGRGAVFSPCETWRYALWRIWDPQRPPLVFCMLNPSTADAEKNDPTVERCERRARRLDHGGVIVVNAYALRSTDPKGLRQVEDPVGPDNDAWLAYAASRGPVVVAWGTHINVLKGHEQRVAKVLLQTAGQELQCLGTTKAGHPRHPLYIPNAQELRAWSCP